MACSCTFLLTPDSCTFKPTRASPNPLPRTSLPCFTLGSWGMSAAPSLVLFSPSSSTSLLSAEQKGLLGRERGRDA